MTINIYEFWEELLTDKLKRVLKEMDRLKIDYKMYESNGFVFFDGVVKKSHIFATKQKDGDYLADLLIQNFKLDREKI